MYALHASSIALTHRPLPTLMHTLSCTTSLPQKYWYTLQVGTSTLRSDNGGMLNLFGSDDEGNEEDEEDDDDRPGGGK